MKIKAWRVAVSGVGEGIVSARTRSGAKWETMKAATDAGYSVSWTQIKAVRAPEYDGWAITMRVGAIWMEEFVRRVMEATAR